MPITVRNGTHKLVVEGLVQNRARSVVTASASDVTNYASYLPIYHNESLVVFQQKYVSLFITLDNVAYVVPANSPGMCIYRVGQKCATLLLYIRQLLIDFQNYSTGTLCRQFAIM